VNDDPQRKTVLNRRLLRKHAHAMLAMLFKKCERFHHPTVEPVVGVPQHFANEMRSVFNPAQIAARGEGRYFAVAFIAT